MAHGGNRSPKLYEFSGTQHPYQQSGLALSVGRCLSTPNTTTHLANHEARSQKHMTVLRFGSLPGAVASQSTFHPCVRRLVNSSPILWSVRTLLRGLLKIPGWGCRVSAHTLPTSWFPTFTVSAQNMEALPLDHCQSCILSRTRLTLLHGCRRQRPRSLPSTKYAEG